MVGDVMNLLSNIPILLFLRSFHFYVINISTVDLAHRMARSLFICG